MTKRAISTCLLMSLLAIVPQHALADTWQDLYSGLYYARRGVEHEDKLRSFEAHILRIEPRRVIVRAMSVMKTLTDETTASRFVSPEEQSDSSKAAQKEQYFIYNLQELASVTDALAIINGGFTLSLSVPIPAGLLVHEGRVIGRLAGKDPILSGVFCMKDEQPFFLYVTDFDPKTESCDSALQSGPVVVEPDGQVGIRDTEPKTKQPYRRSLIAIDAARNLYFIVTSPAFLYDIANFLVGAEAEGGISAQVAINLSGGSDSGMIVAGSPKPFGSTDAVVASAIAVFKRYHIIVNSTKDKDEALRRANELRALGYPSEVYHSDTGYYGVTIGSYRYDAAFDTKQKAIDAGHIATDAYFHNGERFDEDVLVN